MPSASESSPIDRIRLRPLPAGVALAFFLAAPAAIAAGTHQVTTCNDQIITTPVCASGDDGTLRHAYFCAVSGDTIDLTQLQCSTITLRAALSGASGNVTLNGPGRDKLTIEAGGEFRVLTHSGSGTDTLSVNNLTITKGRTNSVYGGGCISSLANISLNSSTVSFCVATASTVTSGGGIAAQGEVFVTRSDVINNTVVKAATPQGNVSKGGGIQAYAVLLVDSTVSGNSAPAGGGVFANALQSERSTIAYNTAGQFAGAYARNALEAVNSTISGNAATGTFGGMFSNGTAVVYNTTIAFNSAGSGGNYQQYAAGLTSRSTYLQSSIVARNTIGAAQSDVGGLGRGAVIISGARNLIMAPTFNSAVPADTISADPLLVGLRDNGGPTSTLALSPNSPAIDRGANFTQQLFDQRGVPRVIGDTADIGAFEFNEDRVFRNGFDQEAALVAGGPDR